MRCLKLALGVEGEDRHAVEVDALVAAADGVDDRLAVVGALADPERAAASSGRVCSLSEQLGLKALRAFLQDRRERIVDGRRERCRAAKATTSAGVTNCQADKPADAGDHQLEPPRQIEIARHRADQHAERQDTLDHLRHAVKARSSQPAPPTRSECRRRGASSRCNRSA